MGKGFCCDGFSSNRKYGIITHIHEDHKRGLNSCLQWYDKIFVSPPTRDLLIAIEGIFLKYKNNLNALQFNKTKKLCDEKITIYPANHILGSSQVFIESENTRILYSSDIREGTNPIESDILIVQPHFGDPSFIRKHKRDDVIKVFIKNVKTYLKTKSINIFACNGKLQEIMNLLYKFDIDVPFLANSKIIDIANVYKKYDFQIKNIINLNSKEGLEITNSRDQYIAFYSIGTKISNNDNHIKFVVSDWNIFTQMKQKISKNEIHFSISDHADFNGLFNYVKGCKPKYVIAENTRCACADVFTDQLRRKLKIKTYVLPK